MEGQKLLQINFKEEVLQHYAILSHHFKIKQSAFHLLVPIPWLSLHVFHAAIVGQVAEFSKHPAGEGSSGGLMWHQQGAIRKTVYTLLVSLMQPGHLRTQD